MITRKDSHAGSWYSRDVQKLDSQLSEWLSKATSDRRHSRAIISPHAGYEYSGQCAGFAYNQIDPDQVKRVFILGPSHYLPLGRNCALSVAESYKTPFYSLNIDLEICRELYQSGEFVRLSIENDEQEHSVEMQLPYIAKVMENNRHGLTIVPIVVGSLSPGREVVYGNLLAPYLADSSNLFVISSDFCHWGRRFQYTYYDRQKGEIWKSIQALDEEGMSAIERLSPADFTNYLSQYGNTICGRHPIGIFLNCVGTLQERSNMTCDFKFLKYAQSERCHSMNESSVSYAAGSLIIR